MQRVDIWLNWLFPSSFTLIGFICLVSGGGELLKGFESYNWEKQVATIIESGIIENGRGQSSDQKYTPRIVYSYTIDGKNYSSDKILFGTRFTFRFFDSSEGSATKWAANYPVGANTTIYVNSEKNSESVILNGVGIGTFILPSLGVVFLIGGFHFFRKLKKSKRGQ